MIFEKIKTLNIFGLFLVLLIIPITLAAVVKNVGDTSFPLNESFLIITDMDVRVDGKSDKNLDHGDKIDDEALPGSTVEFDIEVTNIFPEDGDDVEIEDIEITITIEEDLADDELEEEDEVKDLDPGDDDSVKIRIEIPLDVDEGTFDVLIEIDGDTDDNGSQKARMELELEIEKEKNEVRFQRNSITPSEIKCGRTVQLSTAVINTGSSDEDDVILEITNTELGISFRETFDLEEAPFDDDGKFRKTFTFTVSQEVLPGIYPIRSNVIFDDGSDTETDVVDLTVLQCELFEVDEEEEEEEEVVVVIPPVQPTAPTGAAVAEDVSAPTLPVTEEDSFFQSSGFLTLLIVGEILLVIIAILIVVAVVRRKGE